MSGQSDNLVSDLQKLGLEPEESRVYLFLLNSGFSTPLKISREENLSRTKVYRILDRLANLGLVSEIIEGYGTKFAANSPDKFNNLIYERERELLLLKSGASTLIQQLGMIRPTLSKDTKISSYRGVEGLKQVTWNSTKVKGDFRIYEINSMNSFLDQEFSEKCRIEFAKHPKNKFMQLTNNKTLDEMTEITDHIKQWEPRYIPKKQLDIMFEVMIYNDVYCMYEYTQSDIFIVEIHNQKLATLQKQIFDIIFSSAKPMKKFGLHGKASV